MPVLPSERRLTRRTDFTAVVRGGRRAGRPLLTVHLAPPAVPAGDTGRDTGLARDPGGDRLPAAGAALPLARAGLVVSKQVGGSVVRSRVSRRLRHLLRDRLPVLPDGTRVVVRAAPAAASADSAALGRDLDAALARLTRPARSAR